MPIIQIRTLIKASPEVCFNLARNVEIHTESTSKTKEKAVAGVTSGRIGLGETVTWEAVHFGIKQRLTVKITQFEYPVRFTDEMIKGAFKGFKHVHEFVPVNGQTLMKDTFNYTSPFGWIGRLADRLFLEQYMRKFLLRRNQYLKKIAER